MRFLQLTTRRMKDQGLTLLEVVFVITIFAIMASIVLFNFKGFGNSTAMDNLAQDIALRIVEAQRSATSGALTPGLDGLSDSTAPSYGAYFDSGAAASVPNHSFTYYADQNHDGFFNDLGVCPPSPVAGNECLSVTTITTGEYVSDICVQHPVPGSPAHVDCRTDASLHVTFTRPFHDAVMKACTAPGSCGTPVVADVAYIEIASNVDPTQKRTIVVTALGEVHVERGSACEVAGGTCGVF